MRSSSPLSARRLQTLDAGQLPLPFLVGAAASTPTAVAGCCDKTEVTHRISSSTRSSREKSTSPVPDVVEKGCTSTKSTPSKTAKRKPPVGANASFNEKLLVSRRQAATMLSISIRGLDYMIADKRLATRRIANRVLIPIEEIRKFVQSDHPRSLAG